MSSTTRLLRAATAVGIALAFLVGFSSPASAADQGGVWSGVRPGAGGESAASAAAAAAAAAPQVWGACGNSTSQDKVARTYTRNSATSTTGEFLRGGSSTLNCGTSGYGYRHIVANHQSQWEAKAAISGQNWRDVADIAMDAALTDPDNVYYRASTGNFAFQRLLYLYRGNDLVGQTETCTVIGGSTQRVITTYPGGC